MPEQPFAVISDIHGNRLALEAVLADIEKRNIKTIFNLGDIFYGPLDPRGTAEILMERKISTVCGNEDRILFENVADSPTLHYCREQLTAVEIVWLKTLKTTETINQEILLCHGNPENAREYIIHTKKPDAFILKQNEEIEEILTGYHEKIILCGHDHLPNVIQLTDKLLVNPGSVGLPAYEDDFPFKHYIENGSPHARYCVIEKTFSGWQVEHISIAYDFISASNQAKLNGRDDWAYWLRTGRAR